MLIKSIVFSMLLLFLITFPAYAYLDPGATSILLQALVGGTAATITFFSLYYNKIKRMFSKFIKSKNNKV